MPFIFIREDFSGAVQNYATIYILCKLF